eukprot:156835-Chlamydomonas_euryale.AAC.3
MARRARTMWRDEHVAARYRLDEHVAARYRLDEHVAARYRLDPPMHTTPAGLQSSSLATHRHERPTAPLANP